MSSHVIKNRDEAAKRNNTNKKEPKFTNFKTEIANLGLIYNNLLK